ncbi:MAG: hypothetical protein EXR69_15935 [Myxococcales bacterium]|nr:hypothetical protein [Myxococcales bacterium]
MPARLSPACRLLALALLPACSSTFLDGHPRQPSRGSDDTSGNTSDDTSDPRDSQDSHSDSVPPDSDSTSSAPQVYPAHRVGIFYLAWHAYAYDAISRIDPASRLTVEDVIRGGDLQFSDMIDDAGLYGEAQAFHWHQEPDLGFYSLYRPRDSEATPAEPNGAVAYPDTAHIAAVHAQQLWDAGVDFVYVDLTNLQATGDFADVLGVRPLEVLIEEWGALRRAGTPTPQIAAWLPLTDVGTAEPILRPLLAAYADAEPDLILTHGGKRVLFAVDNSGMPIDAANRAEVEAANVLIAPMWGNLSQGELDGSGPGEGRAGWMQPCTSGGTFTTLITQATPCSQGYTTTSPLGTVLSASRSFQIGYASLPLQAAGRLGGLTFQRQMATAFSVQPDFLLINAWNEHIAQPQANPYDSSLGPLRRSMGMTDATDGSADWLWVDMYGSDLGRDFEPTVEDGGAGYALLQSCLRVYRSRSAACGDSSEACCQLAEDRVLVYSVRQSGGATAGDHVPTVEATEVRDLVANGGWDEVCNPHYGPPGLCGGGTTADGPFHLYASGGADRTALYRCLTTADHFISPDPACEGTTHERLLGYAATTASSDAPRPLTRCVTSTIFHLHALDGPCPAGSTAESVLGYVR